MIIKKCDSYEQLDFLAENFIFNEERLHHGLYDSWALQQFRVIRDHLNSKCLTSIIVFDIQLRSHCGQIRIRSTL